MSAREKKKQKITIDDSGPGQEGIKEPESYNEACDRVDVLISKLHLMRRCGHAECSSMAIYEHHRTIEIPVGVLTYRTETCQKHNKWGIEVLESYLKAVEDGV